MDAKLLISAAKPSQFPDSHQLEVVCVGKSNVGKSTLINGLTNRKNLAYVGKTPGKTRLVNFYEINDKLMLVDVPGYGYAKRSAAEQDRYAVLMESYFRDRPNLKGMILVMDIRRDISEDDWMMIELAKELKLACVIALSKSEKVSYSQNRQKVRAVSNQTKYPTYAFDSKTMDVFLELNQQIDKWIQGES